MSAVAEQPKVGAATRRTLAWIAKQPGPITVTGLAVSADRTGKFPTSQALVFTRALVIALLDLGLLRRVGIDSYEATAAGKLAADVVGKQWCHDGRVGCVDLRRNRKTGLVVGIYHSLQAGMEDDPDLPWSVVCEEHGSIVCVESLRLARSAATTPDWCMECQAVALGEKPKGST